MILFKHRITSNTQVPCVGAPFYLLMLRAAAGYIHTHAYITPACHQPVLRVAVHVLSTGHILAERCACIVSLMLALRYPAPHTAAIVQRCRALSASRARSPIISGGGPNICEI